MHMPACLREEIDRRVKRICANAGSVDLKKWAWILLPLTDS